MKTPISPTSARSAGAPVPTWPAMLATLAEGNTSDRRDPSFWAARRLADRFSGITAAVLVTHGSRTSGAGTIVAACARARRRPRKAAWVRAAAD